MYAILWVISYIGYLIQILFVLFGTVAGFLYLAELIEEHAHFARRILRVLILCVLFLNIALLFEEQFSFWLCALGIIAQGSHLVLIRRFPVITYCTPAFFLAVGASLLGHYLAFAHFLDNHRDSSQLIGYLVPMHWLIPLLLLVSASACDLSLPTMGAGGSRRSELANQAGVATELADFVVVPTSREQQGQMVSSQAFCSHRDSPHSIVPGDVMFIPETLHGATPTSRRRDAIALANNNTLLQAPPQPPGPSAVARSLAMSGMAAAVATAPAPLQRPLALPLAKTKAARTARYVKEQQQAMAVAPVLFSHHHQGHTTELSMGLAPSAAPGHGGFFGSGLLRLRQRPRAYSMLPLATSPSTLDEMGSTDHLAVRAIPARSSTGGMLGPPPTIGMPPDGSRTSRRMRYGGSARAPHWSGWSQRVGLYKQRYLPLTKDETVELILLLNETGRWILRSGEGAIESGR